MKLRYQLALIVLLLASNGAPGQAQPAPVLSGVWTFNRAESEIPQQVGFRAASGPGGQMPSAGGAGRGGGGGPDQFQFDDKKDPRIDELTNEAQNPSPLLTIKQTDSDIRFVDSLGRIRTFRATGQKQTQQLSSGTVESSARWDGSRLVTEYDLGSGRKVIYTYVLAQPKRLVVLVKFESRNAATLVTEVYDAASGG
jgi:hypothetical protein